VEQVGDREARMERRRCSHCRNPIRRGHAVPRQGPGEPVWYHADCWPKVRAVQQRDYERSIADDGPAAAVAPYCVTVLDVPLQPAAEAGTTAVANGPADPAAPPPQPAPAVPAAEPQVPAPRVSSMPG
jgi:hypothetical protein